MFKIKPAVVTIAVSGPKYSAIFQSKPMPSINKNKLIMKVSSLHIYKSIQGIEYNVYLSVTKYWTVAITPSTRIQKSHSRPKALKIIMQNSKFSSTVSTKFTVCFSCP